MTVRFQLVIDCADPDLLARFWAAALGYELEPPPTGFASWDDYWRDVGVPEADLGIGADCIIDPDGGGPRIWFQVVPERKTVKNRLHLDVHVSGGRAVPIEIRRQRVDAEARRLSDLGARMVGVLREEGIDHYAVAMKDPEGNEFDITDGSHSRRDVLTERPGEDAEPSPKPRKALDPLVLSLRQANGVIHEAAA